MALTIEQIQTLINNKTLDARQLVNEIADYLQANPGGGGSSLPVQTGQAGKFLTTDGSDPSWDTPAGGLVYTALLTQQVVSTTSGLLEIGVEYIIDSLEAGDDFTNVGYIGDTVPFIATGTTPTVWTNNTVVINNIESAPVVTLRYNTLGEVPVWVRASAGRYSFTTTQDFDINKVYIPFLSNSDGNGLVGIPLLNGTTVIGGYLSITAFDSGGKLNVRVRCYDTTGTEVDYGSIMTSSSIHLPKIEVYP